MTQRKRLIIYTLAGGTVGSYIPYLWGEINIISFSGIICSSLGSVLGIFLAYKNNTRKTSESEDLHLDEEEP